MDAFEVHRHLIAGYRSFTEGVEVRDRRIGAVVDEQAATGAQWPDPLVAFRLHQFLPKGGPIHTTAESEDSREIETDFQVTAPGDRRLYPLAFCRECGQEYLIARTGSTGGQLFQAGEVDEWIRTGKRCSGRLHHPEHRPEPRVRRCVSCRWRLIGCSTCRRRGEG